MDVEMSPLPQLPNGTTTAVALSSQQYNNALIKNTITIFSWQILQKNYKMI
jgi:hypothetical protein